MENLAPPGSQGCGLDQMRTWTRTEGQEHSVHCGAWREAVSQIDRPPGYLSWAPTFLLFADRRQEYIIIANISDHIDKPLRSVWCVPFQVTFHAHMEIHSFRLGAGVEERDIYHGTLLYFGILNHMNGSNIKLNIKGMLQAQGKWSQMEAWIFRKERRAIEREIRVNTNESWLYKTMKWMSKIYREN